jgi:hypothetical protein
VLRWLTMIDADLIQMARSSVGKINWDSFKSPPPPAVTNAKNFQAAIKGQVEHLQSKLAEDEELVMHYWSGPECLVVHSIFMRSTQLVVLSGVDVNGNESVVMAHMHAVQFACKIMKVTDRKPIRIGFIGA